MGITPLMKFFAKHYGKRYKPNTRETVRRQTMHQFVQAAFVVENPDNPKRPINSPAWVYQVEGDALELFQHTGSRRWQRMLKAYLSKRGTLKVRYARERKTRQLPVRLRKGLRIRLSPGGQNALVKAILEDFASRFTPGSKVLYVGDAHKKFAHFDSRGFMALGIEIEPHGKIPDVVIHDRSRGWLVLIEAVTSHGPVDPKRREELRRLFRKSKVPLLFVTAFPNRRAMTRYLPEISWETEVWVADSRTHLIHFDGERFLGPYE